MVLNNYSYVTKHSICLSYCFCSLARSPGVCRVLSALCPAVFGDDVGQDVALCPTVAPTPAPTPVPTPLTMVDTSNTAVITNDDSNSAPMQSSTSVAPNTSPQHSLLNTTSTVNNDDSKAIVKEV